MKKLKKAPADFTFAQLPHNRKEVFFDCIKLRFGTIACCGLLLLLFALPLIAAEIVYDVVQLNIYNGFVDGTFSEAQASMYSAELQIYVSLAQIVGWSIFAVGLSGTVRVARQLIWGEPIFFGVDFKRGIKQNALRFAGVFMAASVVNAACVACAAFLGGSFVGYVPYGILIFFVIPLALFVLSQFAVYDVGFGKATTNALAFYGKRLWQTLLFTAIVLLFALIHLMPISAVKYLLVSLCTVFLLPLYIMAWLLVSCNAFDEILNKENFPELYDRGVYRLDK